MIPPAIGSEPPRGLVSPSANVVADLAALRPCVAPPADDRLDLVRCDLVSEARGSGRPCAALLAERASLSDAVAWRAVARELKPMPGSSWRAAEALAAGDLDEAVRVCAGICGWSVSEWETTTRAELRATRGAR